MFWVKGCYLQKIKFRMLLMVKNVLNQGCTTNIFPCIKKGIKQWHKIIFSLEDHHLQIQQIDNTIKKQKKRKIQS